MRRIPSRRNSFGSSRSNVSPVIARISSRLETSRPGVSERVSTSNDDSFNFRVTQRPPTTPARFISSTSMSQTSSIISIKASRLEVGVNVLSVEILFLRGSDDEGRPGKPRATRRKHS
ncbi:unnamed protein product [Haemonchus placei]|uniref:Uncharacterized protein n=1 Tax=Haemonchus placei TaxID=6290 RepID=A0A3P8D571_HAEPC|nr:unnamed protein product [Haemonchus placei]